MRNYLRNISGTSLGGRPWRRLVVGSALVGSLAFAGFAFSGSFSVSLGPTGPQPPLVTVNWGDTVQFVNNDTIPHGITSSRPELNSPALAPGQTFTTIVTGRTATYPFRQTGQKNVSLKGGVVSDVTGSVSLKSSKARTTYGQAVELTGSSTFTGAAVALQQRFRGQRGWKNLQSLTSGDDGSFTTTYTPTLSAKYRTTVAGGQIQSGLVTVVVQPKLTISSQAKKTKANHRINVYSKINPAKSAAAITLYQCNASRGAWVRVASRKPSSHGAVSFNWAAPLGKNYLRTTVSHAAITVGYLPPTSTTITVQGVGKAPVRKHKPARPSRSC